MDRNTDRDHSQITVQTEHSRQSGSLLKRSIDFLAPMGSKRFTWVQRVFEHLRPYRRLNRQYKHWIALHDTPDELELNGIRNQIKSMPDKPLISVIMPVYNPDLKYFREAVDSVFQQAYGHWELCIADDASSNPEVQKIIQGYAAQDDRVKFVFREQNGHISAASNSALALASGDFIALLDHDDKLHPLALYHAALTLIAHLDCEMIYSDEDKITRNGKRVDPYFKPDFDPELLLNHNYLIHLGLYRRATVESLGGFRVGFEGSQDYDLNLRMMDAVDSRHIYHLPQVLYHWRISTTSAAGNVHNKPYAADAALRALNEHFERNGVDAIAEVDPVYALYQPQYRVPDPTPSVDLVMFTRQITEKTVCGIETLLANSDYEKFHLVVALGKPADPADELHMGHWAEDPRVSVQSYMDDDHRVSVINRCVRDSSAVYLCLVDENLRGFKAGWLENLIGQASQPGIGSAGAKLARPDGKIESCGIVLGEEGYAAHLFRNLPVGDTGYRYWAVLQKGNSALSSACLLFRREHFMAVGGFDETFISVDAADIDFCLRLREKGLRHIMVPAVLLETNSPDERFNLPNAAVEPSLLQDERDAVKMRWDQWMKHDPSFSPHLSQDEDGHITINLAPRR